MIEGQAPASAPGDGVTVTVFVAVTPESAFEVFTREIDLWWKRGPKFRIAGRRRGALHFEPGVGGRLFESFETDGGPRTFEVGRVTAWEPPARLQLEWRGVNFKPNEKTVVEVCFAATGEGTLVTLQHRGFSVLPTNHPARHGLVGAEFSRMLGMWWGELMTSLREQVDLKSPA
ncbi:MAG TPA: SRPBCC domain-containing protein [Myxococcaceae bacterium]|nr:SRPBCC domain-containing protein [Myxococcaceae bacterium]